MFWCLVRLSTGALSGGLYANPLEMAIQSAVACSEAEDDGLLVSCQQMGCVLVWVVSFSLAVEDGFLLIMDKSFDFSVGQMLKCDETERILSSKCDHTIVQSHVATSVLLKLPIMCCHAIFRYRR